MIGAPHGARRRSSRCSPGHPRGRGRAAGGRQDRRDRRARASRADTISDRITRPATAGRSRSSSLRARTAGHARPAAAETTSGAYRVGSRGRGRPARASRCRSRPGSSVPTTRRSSPETVSALGGLFHAHGHRQHLEHGRHRPRHRRRRCQSASADYLYSLGLISLVARAPQPAAAAAARRRPHRHVDPRGGPRPGVRARARTSACRYRAVGIALVARSFLRSPSACANDVLGVRTRRA